MGSTHSLHPTFKSSKAQAKLKKSAVKEPETLPGQKQRELPWVSTPSQATMHTYNHCDVLLPLLQEVLQELGCAAQGKVLKGECNPMPQLQHIQPIFQPSQVNHLWMLESAEGPVN